MSDFESWFEGEPEFTGWTPKEVARHAWQAARSQGGEVEPVAWIAECPGSSILFFEKSAAERYARVHKGEANPLIRPPAPTQGVPEGWLVRRVDDRITVQHPDIGGYCASKESDDQSAIAPVILYHLAEALLKAPNHPIGEWVKIIEDNCWDLRCTSEPTGGDDYDVIWHVIEHHMAEPHERTLASDLCPFRALERALNPPKDKQEGE